MLEASVTTLISRRLQLRLRTCALRLQALCARALLRITTPSGQPDGRSPLALSCLCLWSNAGRVGNWARTNVVYTFSTKSTSSSQDARRVVFEFDLTSLDVFHASQHSNSAAIAIEGAPNQSVSQSARPRPRPSVVCWQSRWKDPEGGFSY